MMAENAWLFEIAHSAAQIVLFSLHVAGFVVCLRRWHVAPGTHWAAAGFAALIVNSLLNFGVRVLFAFFPINSGTAALSIGEVFQLFSVVSQLIAIGGSLCLVWGLRSLAISLARRDDAVLLTEARGHPEPQETQGV